jgi:hypothetical protein
MLSVIGAGLAPDVFHSGTPMNRNNDRNSRRALLAISGLFAASLVTAGNVETGELQISRYPRLNLNCHKRSRRWVRRLAIFLKTVAIAY